MNPSREPQRISETALYYESPHSIIVVVEHRTPLGRWLATSQVRIPTHMLEASLARMKKPARVPPVPADDTSRRRGAKTKKRRHGRRK